MKKILASLLALCLSLGILAGCGNSNTPAQSGGKKTFVFGDTTFNAENEEPTINPHEAYSGWACIRYGIGETLVHYTDSMELEPWLAKSWENDGNLTWTITLQDNVTFSSGREMDAEAVKQCFEHLLENHDRAPGDTKIADMQADGQVLTITTSEPNPALMNYLGDPYGCIIDVDASDFDCRRSLCCDRHGHGRSSDADKERKLLERYTEDRRADHPHAFQRRYPLGGFAGRRY